jgi:hypothetical protein
VTFLPLGFRLFLFQLQINKKKKANELPEESEQFRFLRTACFANIKGSVGLILAKASVMRISIPLDLSSRSFIPLLGLFVDKDDLINYQLLII